MERVQFQQEQMLAELKDLVQKGVFTVAETKRIMKKRTSFETALVRRVANKADFLRYAAYEMDLEQLRKKRVERLKLSSNPTSISDYALVRRQFHIFERALKKFKDDAALWIQYIHVAQLEGARSLVGRITARALQLHPNTPALYILAASHELKHLSPSAARALLQRGIRLNESSVDMWTEYVKMELGFIENLRRRWDILGIDEGQTTKGKSREVEIDETEVELHMDVDVDDNDAVARNEIMGGAIVKSVIRNAIQAIPKINLFNSLQSLIKSYPSPEALRESLLAFLYASLHEVLPSDPEAIELYATRHLREDLEEEALVDALKDANEELLRSIEREGKHVYPVYAKFVEQWCQAKMDNDLRLYLISSLHSLIQSLPSLALPPSLLSAYIRLSTQTHPPASDPTKVLKLARKYTGRQPRSADVWLALLEAERRLAPDSVEKTWKEARGNVINGDGIETVWLWWFMTFPDASYAKKRALYMETLKESMSDSSLGKVHEELLMGFARLLFKAENNGGESRRETLRRFAGAYLASGKVWACVFQLEKDGGADEIVLEEVFEKWRRTDGVEAGVAWGTWLLENGQGNRAREVIVRSRSCLDGDQKMELERRWMSAISDGAEI